MRRPGRERAPGGGKKRLAEEKFFGGSVGSSGRPNAIRLMNRNNSRAIVLFGSFQLTVASEPGRSERTRERRSRHSARRRRFARARVAARNYDFPSDGLKRVRVYVRGFLFLSPLPFCVLLLLSFSRRKIYARISRYTRDSRLNESGDL